MPACVAYLLPMDGIFREVVVGFHRVAAAHGWVVLSEGEVSPGSPILPDLIVCTGESWGEIDVGVRARTPVISASVDLTGVGVPSVVVDDEAVGRVAAEHLIARGLRSFAVYGTVGEDAVNRFAIDRAAAFRERVEQGGHAFYGWGGDAAATDTLAVTPDEWMHGLRAWLARLPRPTGVLACCDAWGTRLLAECRVHGVRVPEELAVVSVDNQTIQCEMTTPPLSSVIVPWERMGHELASLAVRLLGGRAVPPGLVRIAPGDVVVRRSSDFLAVDDPEVAKALDYIRARADVPIGVPDVVRHTGTYRRELEKRFRTTVGRTIMDEVRRVHIEQAKRLLATTALPVEVVAVRSGFPSAKRLSETFRRELDIAPREYRRQFRLRG